MASRQRLVRAIGDLALMTYWAAAGALVGIGVVGFMTIGAYFICAGGVLLGLGCVLPGLRNGYAWYAVSGLAAGPGYVAWLNRHGPGRVCEDIPPPEFRCVEEWNPLPIAAVALALVLLGYVLWRVNVSRSLNTAPIH